jgi:DNA-binding transcriptional MerR regulator
MPARKVEKKIFYKIGEACKVLDIQPYVLRYWETEFPHLSPDKSKSGQRVYTEEELELIRRIKELLYDEGFTIAGAKKKLEGELAAGGPGEIPEEKLEELDTRAAERLQTLRQGVEEALGEAREILSLLDEAGSDR